MTLSSRPGRSALALRAILLCAAALAMLNAPWATADEPTYSEWLYNTVPTGETKSGIENLRIVAVGDQSFEVSGIVTGFSYQVRRTRTRTVTDPDGVSRDQTETLDEFWIDFTWRGLVVTNPRGRHAFIFPNKRDGSFHAVMQLDPEYHFQLPSQGDAERSVTIIDEPGEIRISVGGSPQGIIFEGSLASLPGPLYKVNGTE